MKTRLALLVLVLTGCCASPIQYPVKANGFIVTETPCPQNASLQILYREKDNALGCYSKETYQGNTYLVTTFKDRDSRILFYYGVGR